MKRRKRNTPRDWLDDTFPHINLTSAETEVIRVLLGGSASSGQVSKRADGISPVHASNLLGQMERKGLVCRVRTEPPNIGIYRLAEKEIGARIDATTRMLRKGKELIEIGCRTGGAVIEFFPRARRDEGIENLFQRGDELLETAMTDKYFHALMAEEFYDVIPLLSRPLLKFLGDRMESGLFMHCLTKSRAAYEEYRKTDADQLRRTVLGWEPFVFRHVTILSTPHMAMFVETNEITGDIITCSLRHPELSARFDDFARKMWITCSTKSPSPDV